MTEGKDKLQWWREARFGMFIHWGLYAIPAGVWKGQEIPGIGEWIMKRAQIPVSAYAELADDFNPILFDAQEWVHLAKKAGMKYLVITAKHHDGFAMYDSACSGYDIVDATPFGKDPMKELAEACQKEGIVLCFYYSQVQDWHHPDAVGNDWDFPDESQKDFSRYLEEKVKPQLRELLTQYGPIGLIWFDTPMTISKEHSQELADFVRAIQPDCLVSGRIGHDVGDYREMPDNRIPITVFPYDWETPATLNDTWGFKVNDHNWKSPKDLIRLLTDINGKGGNYLLNVGPTAEGLIPQTSVDILESVGKWMEENGDAIYGTIPAPVVPYVLPWGGVTAKPGTLYLHVFDWPTDDRLVFHNLKNQVSRVYLLATGEELKFEQRHESSRGEHRLIVQIPPKPISDIATVIAIEIEGAAEMQPL